MNFRVSGLYVSIAAALYAPYGVAETVATEQDDTVVVHGQSFEDYKVDSATGAMRSDVTMLETPQSINVIPEIVLDEQLATTLGDALQNDASVSQGTKKWNREVFSLRGFELTSSNGYLRNGHSLFTHYMLPIETLESIEVIKGPSSLLYGKAAPGGLINMISKKPTHEPMVNVGSDFDNLGSTRYHVDAAGPLNDSGSLRGRVMMVKQDAVFDREYVVVSGTKEREQDRFLGFGTVEADIKDWGMLTLNYEKTEDRAPIDAGVWLDANGDIVGGDKDLVRDAHWAFIDNNVTNWGIDFDLYINSEWTAKISYNNQEMLRHRHDSSPRATENTLTTGEYAIKPFDRHDTWKTEAISADLNGDFEALNVNHRLLVGVNGQSYDYTQYRASGSQTAVQPGEVPAVPDLDYKTDDTAYKSDNKFYGIYVQDMITFNDQWQALIGGRFDQYLADNGDVSGGNDSDYFSPKFGAIFHPTADGSIYVNYSESFNPVSNVVNADDSITERDPEISKQYELGTKWELMDNRLLLTGAVFDITKENISFTDVNDITTQEGEQQHKGAEFSAQGQVNENLFVMATGMYLDAVYNKHTDYTGNTPANVPEWSASAWTRYSVNQDTALNLGMIYQGERWADNANTLKLDAYTRVDAGASYKLGSENVDWDLRFNIENLLDTEYVVGTGGRDSSYGVYQDVHYGSERRFKLSLNGTF